MGVGDQRKCIAYRSVGLVGGERGVAGSMAPSEKNISDNKPTGRGRSIMDASRIAWIIDNENLRSEFHRLGGFMSPDISTLQMVRYLNLEEVTRRIERRHARLRFNGTSLAWIEDGRVTHQWPATSGKRGFSGPEHQHKRSTGPILAGRYTAMQSQYQRWDDLSLIRKIASYYPFDTWTNFPGGSVAWGTHRVWLKPQAGTETFGRSDFSIHGGTVPGSLGCIDLTSALQAFIKEFIYYAKDMSLDVIY